jgi:aspartate/methionine/tyrosine aminotransferase
VKFLLTNSPSNPQGSIIHEDKIKELIAVCKKHNNLPIVTDEIYEHMLFPGQ